jgi:(p)ppGpp synthase/HD superfamily hydrolase
MLPSEMTRRFGRTVTRLVESVEKVQRLERMAGVFMAERALVCPADKSAELDKLRNLILSEVASWRVVILRVASHLERLRRASAARPSAAARDKLKALSREAIGVHAPLAHKLGIHQLHTELQDLSFQALYPRQNAAVREQLEERMAVYDTVLDSAASELTTALEANSAFMSQVESVSLAGRTKEPYSMWRKMLRQRSDAAGVLDAVALRVVLKAKRLPGDTDAAFTARSEALCYEAMRIVGDLYATMQSRSKDYISCAKPNGYQSLHATCLMVPEVGGPAQPFEVQVRTFEMHQHAEFGVAAHWSYKGEGAPAFSTSSATADAASSVSKPSAAVRPTVGYSVPASIVDGKEFVNWLHTELQSRKVFVFGPDGSIWDLDKASATAADIMRLVSISNFYSNVRGPTPSLLVAGKQVPADHMLRNGDTISLVV